MYYQHFGLSGPPFAFNPSPALLFLSAGHREGMAALQWGLSEPSGFTMLVGEVGTGKTTLIYSLLNTHHQGVHTAWVANPKMSFNEMLRQIVGQLGTHVKAAAGKLELLQALDARLASLPPEECIAVIIDEAQDLGDDALEELRLLSNFQSFERRRLQIVLVGQIELAHRLEQPQLRQLNQRIGARALLPTLQKSEIHDYVEYRLRAHGGDIRKLFDRRALRELVRLSGGIPRRINMLCHNAMLLAYAQKAGRVNASHLREAAHDFDHLLSNRLTPTLRNAAVAGGLERIRSLLRSLGRVAAVAAERAPSSETTPRRIRVGTATAAIGLLAVGILHFSDQSALSTAGLALSKHVAADRFQHPQSLMAAADAASKDPAVVGDPDVPIAAAGAASAHLLRSPDIEARAPDDGHASATVQTATAPSGQWQPPSVSPAASTPLLEQPPPPMTEAAGRIAAAPPVGATATTEAAPANRAGATIMVKAGDTLSRIAMDCYGTFSVKKIYQLMEANPQIENANLIYPGQIIHVQESSGRLFKGCPTNE